MVRGPRNDRPAGRVWFAGCGLATPALAILTQMSLWRRGTVEERGQCVNSVCCLLQCRAREEELLSAAETGDVARLKQLIASASDLNIDYTDQLGRTPLHLAVVNEHKEVLHETTATELTIDGQREMDRKLNGRLDGQMGVRMEFCIVVVLNR